MREEQNLARAGPGKRRAHHLADLLGRAALAMRVLVGLEELNFAAERLQPPRDHRRDAIETLDVAAAGFDRAQLLERFDERRALFLRQRCHQLDGLAAGLTRNAREQDENRGFEN